MPLDKAIKVHSAMHSARAQKDGSYAKVLIYQYSIGDKGPFTDEFLANEQHADAINRRLNEHAALLRATGALEPEEA